MKKYTFSLLLSILSLQFAVAQSAETVFLRYFEATGGKKLWDSVSTYAIKQSYKGGSAADYDLELQASFNEKALYKAKTILKRTFIFGIKGNEGWRKVPLGTSDKATQYETNDLSDKEQINMRRELKESLLPFLDYKEKGYIATLIGEEVVNNKTLIQIELSGNNIKYNLYFDKNSGLLARKRTTISPSEIITEEYLNYSQSTFGIKYPAESTYTNSLDKRTLKVTTVAGFNDKIVPELLKR